MDDDNRYIEQRRDKLAALREQGQAYPNHFQRQHLAGELAAQGIAGAAEVGTCILIALDALPAQPTALLDAVSAALIEAGHTPIELGPIESQPGAQLEGFSEPIQFLVASAKTSSPAQG